MIHSDQKDQGSIITTEDGSQTLISEVFGERYHSIYGAKTESQVVFIEAGLHDKMHQDSVSILEMGFGTGLNAYMSWIESEKNLQQVDYVGYEKYPVDADLAQKFKFPKILNSTLDFVQLHQSTWQEVHQLSSFFSFQKIKKDINALNMLNQFDVIYYDAFAPSAQEELWTVDIFQKMFDALKHDGVLVTYCAKGYVKRNLKSVGFSIEALAGPPGKREMTRARKVINK